MSRECAAMDDDRKEPRHRRLKEGRLVFNNRRSVMTCIVRDASRFGARVQIGQPYLVPHEFEFATGGDDLRPARKVWVRDCEMGVQFLA